MKGSVRLQTESGQSTLEFVLVLPIIMMCLLVTIQITILSLDKISLVAAAREGARQGAVSDDNSQVHAVIDRSTGSRPDTATRILRSTNNDTQTPQSVTVVVHRRVQPSVPMAATLFPDVIDMEASVTMRREITS